MTRTLWPWTTCDVQVCFHPLLAWVCVSPQFAVALVDPLMCVGCVEWAHLAQPPGNPLRSLAAMFALAWTLRLSRRRKKTLPEDVKSRVQRSEMTCVDEQLILTFLSTQGQLTPSQPDGVSSSATSYLTSWNISWSLVSYTMYNILIYFWFLVFFYFHNYWHIRLSLKAWKL